MPFDNASPISSALRSGFSKDIGGAIPSRGFFYQHLYVLRLMRRMLNGEIDGYVCGCGVDFVSWKLGRDGAPLEMTLVEVKSCSRRPFSRQAKKTLASLGPRARQVMELFPQAKLTCCLVFNPVTASLAKPKEKDLRKLALPPDWPATVRLQEEPFVSLALKTAEIRSELAFLEHHAVGTAALFADASNAKIFLETLLGCSHNQHNNDATQSMTG